MASTNHTANLNLNQWVGTDPVLMADFNADNTKLDTAIAALQNGMLHIATGSYTGDGTFGSEHPNTLTFDFAPKLVIVIGGSYASVFIAGSTEGAGWSMRNILGNLNHSVTWTGNQLRWYIQTVWGDDVSYTPNSRFQQNDSNTVYRYFALG